MSEMPRVPQGFDEWRALAASDPAGFERMRRQAVEAFIARAPEERRERLQRLQWRVDEARRRAGSPMAACLSLSAMMWGSLIGPQGLLAALGDGTAAPRSSAQVLRFPRGRS